MQQVYVHLVVTTNTRQPKDKQNVRKLFLVLNMYLVLVNRFFATPERMEVKPVSVHLVVTMNIKQLKDKQNARKSFLVLNMYLVLVNLFFAI